MKMDGIFNQNTRNGMFPITQIHDNLRKIGINNLKLSKNRTFFSENIYIFKQSSQKYMCGKSNKCIKNIGNYMGKLKWRN